jgi:hypothetical protein
MFDQPTPSVSVTRPRDSTAAVAIAFAARNGLRIASTNTLLVKRSRVVTAAHAAIAPTDPPRA